MSSKPKNSNVNHLLEALKRRNPRPSATDTPAGMAEPADSQTSNKSPEKQADATQRKARVGKPVQFWLHEEDRRLLRELAAWLAGQGIRPTDSMVVRSALRMAKTGSELLDAYHQAAQLDGRLKQHKPQA
jgi:hypothetical protein